MTLIRALAAALLLLLTAAAHSASFDLATATIADINAAMDANALSSEKLVRLYLNRIEAYDKKGPKVNAVITLNKEAMVACWTRNASRKAGAPRSTAFRSW